MKNMIWYITGGERSGKSSYAEKMALELSDNPVYLATARIWDEDFRQRVNHHKKMRDGRWENIEEEKYIGRLKLEGRVVLLDCITLWLTNIYHDSSFDPAASLQQARAEFTKFVQNKAKIIIVSNEIGMSLHSRTHEARKFVEIHGLLNQYIASKADNAIFMVSGIPLKLK